MTPIILALIALGLWVLIGVWNYRAKELTPALFWSRLIVSASAVLLFGLALYSMRTTQ